MPATTKDALRSTMPILGTTRLRTCFKRLDQSRRPDIPAVRSVTPSVLSTGVAMIRRSSTAAPDRNSARLLKNSKKKTRCRQPENLIRQPGRLSRFAEHRLQINSMPLFPGARQELQQEGNEGVSPGDVGVRGSISPETESLGPSLCVIRDQFRAAKWC